MKKNMKKTLSILLLVCMFINFGSNTFAFDDLSGNDVYSQDADAAADTLAASQEQLSISSRSAEERKEFIVDKGVQIPADFVGADWLAQ